MSEKNRHSEQELTGWVQHVLTNLKLKLDDEPRIGPSAQADIVAHDNADNRFVIEIKVGGEGRHLSMSTITQVRGTAEVMAASGVSATPIVVTDLPVSPASQSAAAAMGVPVIQTSHDQENAQNTIAKVIKGIMAG